MTRPKRILGTVLALLLLPLAVACFEAVAFHLRNRSNASILSSGERREYLLHVPKSYDAARPTPLVLSLHGGAGWPALQRDLSGWNELAERHGFLVAYPAGVEATAGMRAWRARPGPGLVEDVRFISDLIDELRRTYNVDPSRIYADGLSNGGAMAFALSCTLPERLAAVGMIAAAQSLPWAWCPKPQPMPMIAFHGTADAFVPYEGGTSWVAPRRPYPDVEEWTAQWARRNRCAPEPRETRVATDVTLREYEACAEGASVMLFKIHGGGHTWPGPLRGEPLPEWFLGRTSSSVDATRRTWAFFNDD